MYYTGLQISEEHATRSANDLLLGVARFASDLSFLAYYARLRRFYVCRQRVPVPTTHALEHNTSKSFVIALPFHGDGEYYIVISARASNSIIRNVETASLNIIYTLSLIAQYWDGDLIKTVEFECRFELAVNVSNVRRFVLVLAVYICLYIATILNDRLNAGCLKFDSTSPYVVNRPTFRLPVPIIAIIMNGRGKSYYYIRLSVNDWMLIV